VQGGEFAVAVAGGPGRLQRPGVAVGGRAVPALPVVDPAEVVQGGGARGGVPGGLGRGQGVLVQGVGVAVVAADAQVVVQGGGVVGGVLGRVVGGVGGGGEQVRLFGIEPGRGRRKVGQPRGGGGRLRWRGQLAGVVGVGQGGGVRGGVRVVVVQPVQG